jgi:sarcosine oxidase subunit alpha
MAQADSVAPARPLGHVTSSYYSPILGHSIALALVAGGRGRMGETLYVPQRGGSAPVQVSSTVFYDAAGARLNA